MLVCLATYGNRLSSLLENASELRFFELRQGLMTAKGFGPMPRGGPAALSESLLAAGAKTLVCGALGENYAEVLRKSGIKISGWVGGEVETVIAALAEGRLDKISLPGHLRRGLRQSSHESRD
jgi:predicted Fe-Mo cluster-binding NifX family protein